MARQARLTREDWADAALRAMSRGGIGAVAVEPLARELDVTKGSFYWHFKSRAQLIDAALDRWEHVGTESLVRELTADRDPRSNLVALFEAAFDGRDPGFLLIRLANDHEHDQVAPRLRRVTERRIELIGRAFEACGMTAAEARQRALLCYTAYVGMFQVILSAPAQAVDRPAYLSHVLRTLLP